MKTNLTTTAMDNDDLEVTEDKDLISPEQLKFQFSLLDLQRLDAYCRNLADFHLILDILPALSMLFFSKRTGKAVRMSKS